MNCNETRPLLDVYLDGELDLVRHLELETHLKSCPACAATLETGRLSREIMQSGLTRYTAPAALPGRIRAELPKVFPVNDQLLLSRKHPAKRIWLSLAGGGALAAVFCFGFVAGTTRQQAQANKNEVIAAHVRSLMGEHLTDIASTDQHNVKPWFAGKVDFAPPVLDMGAQGFPLVGGRLEQINRRAAVALVYRRRLHTINLFIWPKDGGTASEKSFQATGFHAIGWTRDDLNFLAISDVATADLKIFADAYRSPAKP